jgi:hypothetical protein
MSDEIEMTIHTKAPGEPHPWDKILSEVRDGRVEKIPLKKARGQNLEWLGFLAGVKRRGLKERLPVIGDRFFRRRILAAMKGLGITRALLLKGPAL